MATRAGQRPTPKILTAKELRDFSFDVIEEGKGGYVQETFHAAKGHPDRRLNLFDCFVGLLYSGWELLDVKYSRLHKQWKYKIKTINSKGRRMVFIISPDFKRRRIVVITRW